MRLLLPIPASWGERDAPGRKLYVLPHAPALTVEVGPLVERDELPDELIQRGLRPGERLEAGPMLQHSTQSGWSMQLSQGVVLDAAGRPDEFRMVAQYTVLIFAAVVFVRAQSAAAYHACASDIMSVLEAALPELHSERPAALSELYDMKDAP